MTDWAFDRACGEVGRKPHHVRSMAADNAVRTAVEALARYIRQHEKPPASRETLCAREACARLFEKSDPNSGLPEHFREGGRDNELVLSIAKLSIQLWEQGYGQ